jgi:peroxiredoxin
LRDDFARHENAGAKVYGVNPGSAVSHDRCCARFGFQFPLIVDAWAAIAIRFGAGDRSFAILRRMAKGRRAISSAGW